MDKFITAEETIEKLNIKPFQLFGLVKTEKLEAFTEYGKKVINSDTLEREPRDSLKKILRDLKAKQKAATLGGTGMPGRYRTDEELLRVAERLYREQRLVIVKQPPDTEAVSFTNLSNNMQLAIKTVMEFLFKEMEVTAFMGTAGQPAPAQLGPESYPPNRGDFQKTREIKRWLYGWELLQLRDWTAIELLNHIKAGLPAYDEIGRRIVDLDTLPRHKQTFEEIEEMVRRKWVSFESGSLDDIIDGEEMRPVTHESAMESFSELCKRLYEGYTATPVIPSGCIAISFTLRPGNAEALELLEGIKSFRFKYQDVVDFEQNNQLVLESQKGHPLPEESDPLSPQERRDDTSSTEGKQRIPDTPLKDGEWGNNYFVLDGDYWKVCFQGKSKTVRNLKGMRYIVYLLSNPGQDISILKLMSGIETMPRDLDEEYDSATDEQLADAGMKTGGRITERKSEAAFGEAQRLLGELNKVRETKIPMEIDAAQKEYDDYMKNYVNTVKQDNIDPQFEKERKRIWKSIKTAIDNIGKNHSELGKHLEATIKTGVYCSYIFQEEPIDWFVKY